MNCSNCGNPIEGAKCSKCSGPMKCESGECKCDACNNAVKEGDMKCDACMAGAKEQEEEGK